MVQVMETKEHHVCDVRLCAKFNIMKQNAVYCYLMLQNWTDQVPCLSETNATLH